MVTGLAWTETGGDIIFVEATRMKGKGDLILTGSLGEVMKESARAALSFVQANGTEWSHSRHDIRGDDHSYPCPGREHSQRRSVGGNHHGDGYCFSDDRTSARRDVAMTGEISLTGRVLAIGGLKEKVLAARRAGVKKVLIPERNRQDMDDIPENVRQELEFVFVEDVREAIAIALQ